jgi:2-amino-4-hydroxy-6-hydroxymethyldihydropteridine diphosphokinase
MARLRKKIGPGLTLLRTEYFPRRQPKQRLRHGEREAWIGIGGNLGDVPRRFERLWHTLSRMPGIRVLESSPILINPPFGYLEQPDFYNGVLRIATTLGPMRLLRRLQEVERRFGRVRSFKDAPRTLDLDILFYGDQRVDRPGLQIPHPRWKERDSVRLPLMWMESALPLQASRKLKRRRRAAHAVPSEKGRETMVEETFEAPTPKEAYALARAKYPYVERLELLRARQRAGRDGKLSAEITVAVPEEAYLESLGLSEEEELIREIQELQDQMHRMKEAAGLTEHEDQKVQKVLQLLESKGLRREWLRERLEPVLGTPSAEDEALLLSYLLEEIDEGLEVVPEELSTPRVMMMVGPTGVGKTTTIAKLAARYTYLLDREYKVALINLDTWRAGAYEQLDNFARILHLEHRRAERIEEFGQYLDELKDYDVVLVDTAGISPYDTDRLIKTIEFLKSVQDRQITTSLVISATAKYEDIREIYEHFDFIQVDNAIVTKFDETQRVGDLIAFLTEKHLPVSYISTGQKVPDDLLPASKERILEAFTGELHA